MNSSIRSNYKTKFMAAEREREGGGAGTEDCLTGRHYQYYHYRWCILYIAIECDIKSGRKTRPMSLDKDECSWHTLQTLVTHYVVGLRNIRLKTITIMLQPSEDN